MAARKPSPPRRGMVGKISVREAAELYHCHGWSSEEVARRAGVVVSTVIRAFKRHGVPRHPRGQRVKVLAQDIRRARRKGWTKRQLAEHLGLADETTVINAQKRLGIPWPERDGMRGRR